MRPKILFENDKNFFMLLGVFLSVWEWREKEDMKSKKKEKKEKKKKKLKNLLITFSIGWQKAKKKKLRHKN